jgi:hypothetical protein
MASKVNRNCGIPPTRSGGVAEPRYSGCTGMRRHPSLIPLSRQHHNGLALGVLGMRALSEDRSAAGIATVAKQAVDYFDFELVNHFEVEEQVLFPICGPMAIVDDLVADHRALARMIGELRNAPSESLLEEFFNRLRDHIRREEREFFEEIQRALPPETLEHAGVEIEKRVARFCLRS